MDIKSEKLVNQYIEYIDARKEYNNNLENLKKKYHRNLKIERNEIRKKTECSYCGIIGCLPLIDMCEKCYDFDRMENRWWNNSKLKEQSRKLKEAYKNKLISKDIFIEKRDKLLKKEHRTTREYKIAVFRRKQKLVKPINTETKKYKTYLKDYIKNI